MEQTLKSYPGQVRDQYACESCGRRSPLGWMFAFKRTGPANPKEGNEIIKCLFDALRHPPLVRRSLKVALVVGTLLTVLNQGDILLAGNWYNDLLWKIPLTYCVPFGVATFGALSSARR